MRIYCKIKKDGILYTYIYWDNRKKRKYSD